MAVQDLDDPKTLLEEMRLRFEETAAAESRQRTLSLEDVKFKAGQQWDEQILRERNLDRRPCLTINKLVGQVRQITNEQRQMRPSIQVNPVDDAADIDTAKIYQGIIRHIEYTSSAEVARDTAFESMTTCGIGYYGLMTKYANALSMDQQIAYRRILNPFSVYMDPYAVEPDRSDANYAFITDDISKEEYHRRYPDSELCSLNNWTAMGDRLQNWISPNTVRLAEYFWREHQPKKLLLLSDNTTILEEDLRDPETGEIVLPPGVQILADRDTETIIVHWATTNGLEILEHTTLPCDSIPIIAVIGDETVIDGQRTVDGIIRYAKDPQRMYNYWVSAETETIALAPRAPIVGAEGQFEGFEQNWKQANVRNFSYLEYKPKSLSGELLPPPSRQVYEPPIVAITNARLGAADDIKATTGIYDASLGQRSNETSGKAILARSQQSSINNFHFSDNLSRAIKYEGRLLLQMIPRVYRTATVAAIIHPNDEHEIVTINKLFREGDKDKKYDLNVGTYDVTITIGPSYTTKRQESAAWMVQMTQAYPPLFQIAGDIMLKNMDVPGAQEIAERLKKTLPPNLQDTGKDKVEIPAQVQAQLEQMAQMIDNLTKQLNEAQNKLDSNILEIESKERIEFAKMQVDTLKTAATLDNKNALAAFEAELAGINRRLQLLNIQEPVEQEAAELA